MTLRKRYILTACVALALAGTASGVAIGSSSHRAAAHVAAQQVRATPGQAPEPAVLSSVSTFNAPLGAISDGSSQAKLKRLLAPAAADGLASGSADLELARVAPIAGTQADAWIAPAGNGICTYLPDPVDGYGAGCSTLTEIEAGTAYAVLFGDLPKEEVMFAAVVPDGAAAPSVQLADGSVETLGVHSNVAAAILPSTATVELTGTTVSLARFTKHITKIRAAG
jgi:hypothetical protein